MVNREKLNGEMDIMIITMSRWDNIYSSAILSLGKEFAKNNRVFYIDHPLTLKDLVKLRNADEVRIRKEALLKGKNRYRQVPGFPENFTAVTPGLTIPVNWLSDGPFYSYLSRINERIVWNTIRKTIAEFNIRSFIFLNSFDPFYVRSLPADIKPKLFIYQSRDDITQEAYIARHGVRLEEEIINYADISLATSGELARNLSTDQKKVHYLPNGADTALFNTAFNGGLPIPDLIKDEKRKIIGYIGNIDPLRMDFALIRSIALAHPDKLFLMIGKKHPDDQKLEELTNIVFTGPKHLSELPAWLQGMDVAIIPFACNTLTRSIYPLKINEYLAAGCPVVSTSFSDEVRSLSDVVYLAENASEFAEQISLAISENSTEKRNARAEKAKENSWEARVRQFWEIVSPKL